MNNACLLLIMIFLHIVDDYYLQGWLASAKQRKYWEDNAPQSLYKYDYVWALLMHSFSWSFMIMLPVMYLLNFNVSFVFVGVFLFNVFVHGYTDNQKANWYTINLWEDQGMHMFQIVFTWALFVVGVLR